VRSSIDAMRRLFSIEKSERSQDTDEKFRISARSASLMAPLIIPASLDSSRLAGGLTIRGKVAVLGEKESFVYWVVFRRSWCW
jgi:hypothetical protein